ncbi:MAG: DUF2092 domain-containing protein [Verrucomicrobiales bacterium]
MDRLPNNPPPTNTIIHNQNIMKTNQSIIAQWLAIVIAGCLFHHKASAEIEPAARELAKAVTAKLGGAQSIRLNANHKLDPALGVGAKVENGPIKITMQRPNRVYSIQRAGDQTLEIAYDGKTFCVMHPALKHHAIEPLKAGSVDQFADSVDERFGFRPPLAELLSSDVSTQLFRHVTSARIIGTESVGWTRCQRLQFEQPGITGDLWVGVKDKLPRRYRLTFTGIKGSPTWDIRLSKWELNVPVDESLFTKRPAADSYKIQMLKSR